MRNRAVLAEAIEELRTQTGSHDRLAARLRELAPEMRPSRQKIIDWERGAIPSEAYRPALIELGIPEDLFPVARRSGVPRRLAELEAEVADLRAVVLELLERLDSVQAEVRSGAPPRSRRTPPA